MKKTIKKEELYCRVKTKETSWVKCTQPVLNHELFDYAIELTDSDPVIEAPEGYRIVSMEDRKRCKYPVDCEVMFRPNGGNRSIKSEDSCRWNDGFEHFFKFFVPADYVFAEDRVNPSHCFVEYPIYIDEGEYRCNVKHHNNSGRAGLHVLPSIVGFAGVKFKLDDNGLESNWTGNLTYHYETKAPATPIAARFCIKGDTK